MFELFIFELTRMIIKFSLLFWLATLASGSLTGGEVLCFALIQPAFQLHCNRRNRGGSGDFSVILRRYGQLRPGGRTRASANLLCWLGLSRAVNASGTCTRCRCED